MKEGEVTHPLCQVNDRDEEWIAERLNAKYEDEFGANVRKHSSDELTNPAEHDGDNEEQENCGGAYKYDCHLLHEVQQIALVV